MYTFAKTRPSNTQNIMRKALFTIVLLAIAWHVFPQSHLTSSLNMPHAGDVISKQQVEYKDPGRSGENVLWDFSQLEAVNPKYTLTYTKPELTDSGYVIGQNTLPAINVSKAENLVIGKEHETSYFYCLRNDTLLCLGHENAVVRLWYNQPLLLGVYPSVYQEPVCLPFSAEGLYSMQVPIRTHGTTTIEQDAYGMMILPSGDTLRHVSRIKSLQEIIDISKSQDSLSASPQPIEMETYRWYAKGYRYPVFETICSYNYFEGNKRYANFTTAFFYPPEEAYFNDEHKEDDSDEENDIDPWEGLTYNIYPNPVSTYLEVEMYLPREANVVVLLTSSQGMPVQKKQYPTQPEGLFHFQLDLVSYTAGNYVLDIWLNDHLVSENILKL